MKHDLFNKPYYVFRPAQVVRRIAAGLRSDHHAGRREVLLPWRTTITVRPDDEIGSSILKLGLFDLCVSEAIWRLLDSGERAVDVGANIGHMTSLMAVRAGPRGQVSAFEPHPELFAELSANAARWQADPRTAPVRLHDLALSDRAGTARLATDAEFAANRGSAALREDAGEGMTLHEVRLARLDELIDGDIGVLKVDVEGHEEQVLRGARELLVAGRVRDILFEEWEPAPTAVTRLLEDLGYTLFSIDQRLLGPTLGASTHRSAQRAHQAPSYLATRDPVRARSRMRGRGWRVLRRRAR